MNIVIVGHIDHGKSTLIGRLLFDTNSIPESIIEEVKASSTNGIEFAYFLDCLEEERAQNITIDTTQTFFKTAKRRYTIIDAPGHLEFIKNMVSGASLAEAAVIMVDVTRGMEEQTKRHGYILSLLGLTKIIVAVNKMDAVAYNQDKFTALSSEIRNFFGKLNIKPLEIIPVAAKAGDNITTASPNLSWFQGPTLIELLDSLEKSKDLSTRDLRFPIQDVYKTDGKQTIVGRIESGTLKPGQKLTVMPRGEDVTVSAIRVMEGTIPSAEAGKCIGVELSSPVDVKRGEVLCASSKPQSASGMDTILFSMADTPVSTSDSFLCQIGTQSVPCSLSKISKKMDSSTLEVFDKELDALQPTQVGEVTLKFEKPLVYENFQNVPGLGRFVLIKNGDICAAGIINR